MADTFDTFNPADGTRTIKLDPNLTRAQRAAALIDELLRLGEPYLTYSAGCGHDGCSQKFAGRTVYGNNRVEHLDAVRALDEAARAVGWYLPDDVAEDRCPRHVIENLRAALRKACNLAAGFQSQVRYDNHSGYMAESGDVEAIEKLRKVADAGA